MPLINRFNAMVAATLGAGKENDGVGFLCHKLKDGGATMWLCPVYHSRTSS
ncbi:DUF4102 domain-containing protein [Bartonella machadoae]|nr:DUF4102 domain-containing protein [Bartonella machadoae]UNE55296.1 DUF4102 domain-containing protein [Bartonella machadoae]